MAGGPAAGRGELLPGPVPVTARVEPRPLGPVPPVPGPSDGSEQPSTLASNAPASTEAAEAAVAPLSPGRRHPSGEPPGPEKAVLGRLVPRVQAPPVEWGPPAGSADPGGASDQGPSDDGRVPPPVTVRIERLEVLAAEDRPDPIPAPGAWATGFAEMEAARSYRDRLFT